VFRKVFKVHPDEFELPGVDLNVETYLQTLVPLDPENR
jgi:hypothetical protein